MTSNGNGSVADSGSTRPLVLLCECAGTMMNIAFDRLEAEAGQSADTLRGRHWCSREGQARMLELMEAGDSRPLVFAGCSQDFAARRFHKLLSRGLQLEVADIREGCSWVHGDDVDAVTDKAVRVIRSSVAYPDAPANVMAYAERNDSVVVIGGGVAGTQAAAELAQMGHHVELVERRPFLGGRAARIGTVFPTNDCGQCLPTTDAQAGTRKCFHRNVAIDHPDLHIWRRSTVESVTGRPGDFEVTIRQLPNMVTSDCVNCGSCETVCPVESGDAGKKAIFTEFYDGRVVRTVDLDTCTFCGACAEQCPVEAIDFAQSPQRTTVKAGAVLTATGCEPAPEELISYLGYGHDGVVTQVELAEMLDDWAGQASLGRMPVGEVVMIQCAGSRDRKRLPYCSRLCCMIALKHAIRLKTLFPEMKVTICYLEMRTAGVGYENWFLAARKAGVQFLRGTPPEVQFDGLGRPVIEVEDVTAARKTVLRPDVVVLSAGLVPAIETETIAQTLGIDRDEDGFIEILDRKNRATETTGEGIFVCGSAAGPKALIEVNTEASAVASEIHNFLSSAGRRTTPASQVDAARCVGCDTCMTMCPFGAITLVERPVDAPRPAEVKDDGKLAVIDPDSCRACGICAANCPELADRPQPERRRALRPHRADDRGRREAGRRPLLQGVRRRRDRPERPAARPLPGVGPPDRAALPGPCERAAHRRGSPSGRGRRLPRGLCRGPLPVPQRRHQRPGAEARRRGAARGRGAVDACRALASVRRRPPERGTAIRLFQARAVGDVMTLDRLEDEMSLSRRAGRGAVPPGEAEALCPRR